MASCPSSWTQENFCSCPETPPDNCLLWGVPAQWLIVVAVLLLLALGAGLLVILLLTILGSVLRSAKRQYWTYSIKTHLRTRSKRLLRWGLLWASAAALQLPTNVYNVLRYLFSIPFFILLLIWIQGLFEAVSEIVQEELKRSGAAVSAKGSRKDALSAQDAAALGHEGLEEAEEGDTSQLLSSSSRSNTPGEGPSHAGVEQSTGARAPSASNVPEAADEVLLHGINEGLRVIKYIVFLFVFIIGLQSNNVPVVDFFETATLFTLSIVFAAQPWIRNLVGGLMVFFDNKFGLGDMVRVVGMEGYVHSITLRTTVLERADKSLVYVPNARVLEQPVTNLSRGESRLLEVRAQLSRDTPVADIRRLLAQVEQTLQGLHSSFVQHPENRSAAASLARRATGQRNGLKPVTDFVVVLDNMFELLVWISVTGEEREESNFGSIQTEVMLAVTECMSKCGVRPASAAEQRAREDLAEDPACLPERRSVRYQLDREAGRPFSFTGLNDDYHDDDVDLAMASVATLNQQHLNAQSALRRR